MAQVELSLSERRIITALSLNARASLSKVAVAAGVSRQSVGYTLEKLEAQKVLESFYGILNIVKMGFFYYRIYFRFQNITPARERSIIQYFRRHRNVGWVCRHDGDWDLGVAVWTKGLMEFEDVLDQFLYKFGRVIEDKSICLSTRIYHLKHKFLLEEKDSLSLVFGGEWVRDGIDDVDYGILGILTKTARRTYREIGDRVGVSPKTVQYRMARLQDQGVILGYNLKLNTRLLGYTHYKVFLNLINISKDNIARLIAYLTGLTSTIYITKAIGIADLEFEVVVPDSDRFGAIMRQLRYHFPMLIRGYSSIIVAYEPYINYLPQKK